jgi:hypothetical protein
VVHRLWNLRDNPESVDGRSVPTQGSSAAIDEERHLSLSGLVLSLGFWAALFAAAAIVGVVSLGPRWVRKIELERTYLERQVELVDLQQEVRRLESLADRLASDRVAARRIDPHRAVEMSRPGRAATAIELSPELRHDPRAATTHGPAVEWSDPWYLPLLQRLNDSPRAQAGACLVAAGLLLFGFVFLHENAGAATAGRALVMPFASLGGRYRAARGSDLSNRA